MTLNQTVAHYDIYVRDASLNLVGQVDQPNSFTCVRRFNAVGTWTLDVDADHPMAGYLATKGYGIVVNRTVVDASTGVVVQASDFLSGPIRGWNRAKQGNTLTVNGLDDLCWVAMRDAWPVTSAPNFAASVTPLSGLLRYYRLGEASGTTATDSKSAINGTYSGSGVTYGVAPGIDDANTAVTLDGAAGWVSLPTTSLPTGNSAWTLGAWVNLTSLPSPGNLAFVVGYGTATTAQNPLIYIDDSGSVVVTGFSFGDTGSTTLTPGQWYFLVGTWDGTNMTCYVNGAVSGAPTQPGAMTTPATGLTAAIGSDGAGTADFFPGSIDEVIISNTALDAATIAQLYATGVSRFGTDAYDTQTGVAETVIHHYVNANCISAANDRLGLSRVVPGLSLAADGGHGSTVTGNARFDALVLKDGTGLLQTLAQASSPALGFEVTQSGTNLVFSVYVPSDKTGSIIFSDELGNVADFTYSVQAPDIESGGNVTLVGGSGTGTLRILIERDDATALTDWGRVESFTDARDTSDLVTLEQRGDAQLAQSAEQTSFSAVLAPVQSMVYGVDFDLGDSVTVVVDGVAFTDIVREVQITLDTNGGETVVPAIGTPFNASPKDALMMLAARLRAAQAHIARLQRAQ